MNSFPAQEIHVVLFLVSLIQSGQSLSVLESYYYAINWHHSFGKYNPCQGNLCKATLEAAKRILKRTVVKKEPLTIEIISKLFDFLGGQNMSLLNLRTITIILLSFAGFLRYDEVSALKRADFEINSQYMKVFIEKSKTDIPVTVSVDICFAFLNKDFHVF